MILPNYTARELLAEQVKKLMEARPTLSSPRLLAKAAHWPAGKKKGKPVSERQIRYLLDTSDDAPSPTLDLIVAVAKAFDVAPWQLLVDDKQLRIWAVGKLFSESEVVGDEEVAKFLPPAPPEDLFNPRRVKKGEE